MGDELLAELARQDALGVRDRYYGWLPEPERTAMLEAMTRIARAGLAHYRALYRLAVCAGDQPTEPESR